MQGAIKEIWTQLTAQKEHTPASLGAALKTPVSFDDIAPWMHFDKDNYKRNLVASAPHVELRLLCWQPEQSSSVHAHGSSACAFKIIRGSATETVLGERDRVWTPDKIVVERGTELIHQVANNGGDALVTLHAYSPPLPVDAPSRRQGKNIVIVGGGFAGIAAAYHMLQQGSSDLRITVVERGPWLGRGIAYGVDSQVYRLNVPASRMSIDPDKPNDFVEWAKSEKDPDAFLSRSLYGNYVVSRLGDIIRQSKAKLRLVRGEAHHWQRGIITLSSGRALNADKIILATGIAPRLSKRWMVDDPRVVDGWDECGLATLPSEGRIAILGAGLTALDVIAVLQKRKFKGQVVAISQRGLLPRPHAHPLFHGPGLSESELHELPRSLRGMIDHFRRQIRLAIDEQRPWQYVLDAARPHLPALWQRLSDVDRGRFLKHVRPYWEVLRHRAPLDALALVEHWRSEKRFMQQAGKIIACEPTSEGIWVTLRPRGQSETQRERFDAVVRCIGPALTLSENDSPLLKSIIDGGCAAVHPTRLGVCTDAMGRLVDASGVAQSSIYTLGALRRASSWETTSVPDIAKHALSVAKDIVQPM